MIPKLLPLLWLSASAYCTTINFASQGTAADPSERNIYTTGNNLAVAPNPAWAPALPGSSWVSYEQSGNPNSPGFVSPPNGQQIPFLQCVILGPGTWYGSVTFMADDSASFSVNNYQLMAEASQIGNTYHTCSDKPPGCLTSTAVTIDIPVGLLGEGTNVLTWVVAQRAGSSFGLDYVATITDGSTNRSVAPTPEPGTLALIGVALIGLVWRRK